jgi:tetratricopeptide (TPR) repeat protein
MDPLGTITCYFPFIEEETKNVLESTMAEASDYYDFVHRLCEVVLNSDSPIMVVYFAIHHCILAMDYKLIEMIREKYGGHTILGPNLFISSAYEGTVEDVKKVHELADAVLATEPEDWLALEMHFMKFEADMRNYPQVMYSTSTMDKIQELIASDPRLGYYEVVLDDYLAIRAHADGDTEERIRCIERGIEVAEKFDDRLRLVYFLTRKAHIISDTNRAESKKLLEQAYQIVDTSLGTPAFFAEVLDRLSALDTIRGEYNSAITRYLQVVSIRERAGLNTGNASLVLSTLYNVIGEFESGLEWAQMAEDQFKSRPYLINRAVLNQIWSLILLKRQIEAQALLDTSRESILKSGDESQLAWLNFVTGILETEQGDFQLASSSIEEALRIYEQQGWAYQIQLIFLHHLAKIDVFSSESPDAITPSLAILEEKAVSEDLPGILGQVLLLKADIAIKNNDDAQLREIVQQLRELSEKEKLQFLKPYFDRLMKKL